MNKEIDKQGKKLAEVIKKAWADETFMARLLEDATTVLAEEGIKHARRHASQGGDQYQ
jgi:hypothetical protein